MRQVVRDSPINVSLHKRNTETLGYRKWWINWRDCYNATLFKWRSYALWLVSFTKRQFIKTVHPTVYWIQFLISNYKDLAVVLWCQVESMLADFGREAGYSLDLTQRNRSAQTDRQPIYTVKPGPRLKSWTLEVWGRHANHSSTVLPSLTPTFFPHWIYLFSHWNDNYFHWFPLSSQIISREIYQMALSVSLSLALVSF